MDLFSKWARREYRIEQRVTATLIAGVFFVVLLPLSIIKTSSAIDAWLGIPRIAGELFRYLVGGIVILIGLVFALWSIAVQLTRGRGTPLPMMATQNLLTSGPFRYCRNPMTLGAILLYLGIGIVFGSISAMVIVFFLAGLLILYLKRVEERELEARFGDAYLEYRDQTPFLIPRIRRNEPDVDQSSL
ncbi:MAG: hypothetical protein GTO14_23340 [Anaerolineales bacterium]|nr:hypothetical protein [Anaerolineales bacterium]